MAMTIAGATSAFAQARNYPESYLRYAGDPTKQTDPAHQMPGMLKDVTFRQQLGEQLPLDAAFKDEAGRDVRLGDYFKTGKPVVFAFVYYQCTMLCTQVMNGISSALKVVPFEVGKDFDVVLVSFDPRDTPQAATEKKAAHLQYWSTEKTAGAWHFLTGTEPEIRRATQAAGFSYQWDERNQQFAHVSGVLVTTPDGTAVPLLLRHRVLAQGAAAGARGIGEGRDRVEDRRAAALLLSLRPRVGTLRCGRHESDPAGRRGHRGAGGRLHPADAASRNAHARGGSRVGIMLSSIPIFPAQASTFAADVDKLYFPDPRRSRRSSRSPS
jgi:cytochrome oxidase Cu insertion factor (SCO1/SenC/PrrC family)